MPRQGTLSRIHRSGRIRRHKTVNRNPLRLVVGRTKNEYGAALEVLECGHHQRPKKDFLGETNAYRRRCRQCGKLAAGST